MCYHFADLGRVSHVESGSAWCRAGTIEGFEKFKMAAKKTIKIKNDIQKSFLCQIFIVIHHFSCFRRQRIYRTNYRCILSNISWYMISNLIILVGGHYCIAHDTFLSLQEQLVYIWSIFTFLISSNHRVDDHFYIHMMIIHVGPFTTQLSHHWGSCWDK